MRGSYNVKIQVGVYCYNFGGGLLGHEEVGKVQIGSCA
jgi:hypothetical protein